MLVAIGDSWMCHSLSVQLFTIGDTQLVDVAQLVCAVVYNTLIMHFDLVVIIIYLIFGLDAFEIVLFCTHKKIGLYFYE